MKINKYLLGVVAAATLLVSCNDRELKELTSQAYIAQTGTQAGRIGSLQLGDSEVSTDINVRLSSPQAKDEAYTLELSQDALDAYNKINGTSYTMLPADQVVLSSSQVVVKAGARPQVQVPQYLRGLIPMSMLSRRSLLRVLQSLVPTMVSTTEL